MPVDRLKRSEMSPFGHAAELYEEVRPGWPRALVADAARFAGISPDSRVVEVGCGTGKATRLFAPLCREIICIEPDLAMLDVARRVLKQRKNVRFVESTFEEWPLGPDGADLLISAQAFHWVKPEIGYEKAGRALKPGGSVALFWHVDRPHHDALRQAMDVAYREHAPELTYRAPGGQPGSRDIAALLERTGLFGPVSKHEYPRSKAYDADTWLKMLSTFSDHIRLPEERRLRLFDALRRVMETHGVAYRNRLVTTLFLAKRV